MPSGCVQPVTWIGVQSPMSAGNACMAPSEPSASGRAAMLSCEANAKTTNAPHIVLRAPILDRKGLDNTQRSIGEVATYSKERQEETASNSYSTQPNPSHNKYS